jgi:hypothetical protein
MDTDMMCKVFEMPLNTMSHAVPGIWEINYSFAHQKPLLTALQNTILPLLTYSAAPPILAPPLPLLFFISQFQPHDR